MNARTVRTLTKIGMVGSLAILVLPLFHERAHARRRGRESGINLHTWAGLALVGFAVWHYNCYQPREWIEGSARSR